MISIIERWIRHTPVWVCRTQSAPGQTTATSRRVRPRVHRRSPRRSAGSHSCGRSRLGSPAGARRRRVGAARGRPLGARSRVAPRTRHRCSTAARAVARGRRHPAAAAARQGHTASPRSPSPSRSFAPPAGRRRQTAPGCAASRARPRLADARVQHPPRGERARPLGPQPGAARAPPPTLSSPPPPPRSLASRSAARRGAASTSAPTAGVSMPSRPRRHFSSGAGTRCNTRSRDAGGSSRSRRATRPVGAIRFASSRVVMFNKSGHWPIARISRNSARSSTTSPRRRSSAAGSSGPASAAGCG